MRVLNKAEEKKLQICLERVRDCQFRLADCWKMLVDKGWLIKGMPDALSSGREQLECTESLIVEIQKDNGELKR